MTSQFAFLSTLVLFTLCASCHCARVDYHVWYTSDPVNGDRTFKQVSFSDVNVTYFIDIMGEAARGDANYAYSFTQYPFGIYIRGIGGYMENVNENIFWYLYELQSPPDVNNPPKDNDLAKSAVNDLVVHDGGIYLFWLRPWTDSTKN
ncbi:uncharacterized protein CG3556 [Folsomia candida]|uniref:Transcobalamin-1 n=1 Tax=Folsomia candida TaxID=158441 RepID=A0A226EQS9_FOLCA|nr:uncharacterized protein CG3556 [Folsomia candida]OXA59404.1 Transcobalamin-1 [Folsomia candida]